MTVQTTADRARAETAAMLVARRHSLELRGLVWDVRQETEDKMKECEALGMIREARALLLDESKSGASSKELAMTITKLEEAILWRQSDMQKKEALPPGCTAGNGG